MPAGRPSAMTPEVRKKVLIAIRAGNYREVAATYAGVTPQSLRAYLRKKDDESAEFLSAILEAEAAVEIELVGTIKKLAAGDLKAATWYLTHKFPKRWAENPREMREALKLLRQVTGAKPNA